MMLRLYAKVQSLVQREEGQGMVEYAMIVGLVSVGVIVLLTLLGGQVQDIFTSITNTLKTIAGVRQS
jgi:pilus assembly protein Flp/PilA